jgi:hypothetical protein
MKLGSGPFCYLILALLSLEMRGLSIARASFRSETDLRAFQYASENSPTLYFIGKPRVDTQNFLGKAELYFESGPRGTWSLDPDPVRYHFSPDEEKKTRIWVGRDHPLHLLEDRFIEPTSALGSIWVQNQLDALNPRVSGWIGGGLVHSPSQNWNLVLAYSPIFLPSFGPGLGFTERGELNPARFARLPPESVTTGGVTLPIRYQLRVGQLSELLLRHQVFLGSRFTAGQTSVEAFAFTAPRPDPVPLTSATLSVGQNSVNANVLIQPQFPREYWSGIRIQQNDLPFKPAFELVQNLEEFPRHVVSLTGFFTPSRRPPSPGDLSPRASFGVLSHFQKRFDSPRFTDLLCFLRVPFELTARLIYRTILQTTLLPSRRSLYWMSELEYSIEAAFSAIASLRVLAGEDSSYFGEWRNQGSLSLGVRRTW